MIYYSYICSMGFEDYILGKGYQKMVMNSKTRKLEAFNGEILSTMYNLDYWYVKEGCEPIIYGLYEADKPPVWHWPKPYALAVEGEDLSRNDGLNRVYQKYTNEEIYNALIKNGLH